MQVENLLPRGFGYVNRAGSTRPVVTFAFTGNLDALKARCGWTVPQLAQNAFRGFLHRRRRTKAARIDRKQQPLALR